MEYHCVDCDMTVTGLKCAKCNANLVHDVIDLTEVTSLLR